MFNLPENLSGLSNDELGDLLNEGLDAFRELGISAESDDAAITEGERIAPLVHAIRAEQQARVAAADARAQRAHDLLATVPEQTAENATTAPTEPAPDGDNGSDDDEAEQEAPTPTPTEEAPVAENTPQPVAASSGSPVQRAAANAPAQQIAPRRVASLIAAADVSGFAAGQELDHLGLAGAAIVSRLKSLPRGMAPSPVRQRYGAAVIRKDFDLAQGRDFDDYSLVQRAGEEPRLPGGSLVAAGGWCAPSETVYDMCTLETVSGILDLPEFGVTRGGIRYTPGPDFSDIYNGCGFHQTEADAIAGECKICCEVDCPDFEEVRLDAVGYCVKVPILTEAAYPELTRRFTEGALVAHAHKVNAWTISQINTAAGAGVTVATDQPLSFTLDVVELQAIGMRYQYRLGESALIEMVAPIWLKGLIRMDIGRRTGQQWQSVTDAQVESNLSARNIKAQWVYDWQDLLVAGCVVTLPANAQVLLYPAGTWTKGTSDVISMDAVYDSVGLESNTYTGIFVEEGVLVVQRCTHTCKVTIPICVSGETGAATYAACLAAAA
jgi:hypothetical protein